MIEIKTVVEISRSAGNAILNYYEDEIDVTMKEDQSPLTKADMASHFKIVDSLRKIAPDIPVLSEESGIPDYDERKSWEKYWLVDPLDGTKEFIKKNGEFTVNIALIEENQPTLGVVHVPAKAITYFGKKGGKSYRMMNDGSMVPIYSEVPDKSKPLKVVASRSHSSSDLSDKLKEMGIEVGELVPAGSSLKFCLLAEGSADVYPRFGPTMEWDTAAGDAVFRFSGRKGERESPLRYNKPTLKNDGFVIGLH